MSEAFVYFEGRPMNPPKTRKEREVWQACSDLYEEGIGVSNITGEIIAQRLEELGYYRGSHSDIYRFRKSWLSNKNFNPSDLNNPSANSMLTEPILVAANKLRTEIYTEVKDEIDKIRAEAKAKIEALTGDIEALKAENMKLTEEKRKRQALFDKLSQDYEVIINSLRVTQQERDLLQERLSIQETHLSEIRLLLGQQVEDLKKVYEDSISGVKDQLKIKESEHAKMLSELKEQHEDIRHRLIVEIDSLKVSQQKTAKQVVDLQQVNQRLLIEKDNLQKDNAQSNLKILNFEQIFLNFEKDKSTLEGEGKVLKQELNKYKDKCSALNQDKASLSQQLKELQTELNTKSKVVKLKKVKID